MEICFEMHADGILLSVIQTTIVIIYYYVFVCASRFFISSYGAPLAQRASYLALHSSLFGPDGAVNYDYSVTNSINSLLIGSSTH